MGAIEAWLAQAHDNPAPVGRPLVSLCYAQSLDGSLAARRGQSLALSGLPAQRVTHQLRAAHDAILIGIGTLLADDPSLTVRLAAGDHPQPVVLDSRLRTPMGSKLLHCPKPAWIMTGETGSPERRAELENSSARVFTNPCDETGLLSLPAVLEKLHRQGVRSLMVEGGARVLTSFLRQRLADRLCVTIAPRLVGGLPALGGGTDPAGDFPELKQVVWEPAGEDMILWAYL